MTVPLVCATDPWGSAAVEPGVKSQDRSSSPEASAATARPFRATTGRHLRQTLEKRGGNEILLLNEEWLPDGQMARARSVSLP